MSDKRCGKCRVLKPMESFISLQNGKETANCGTCRSAARRSVAKKDPIRKPDAWQKWCRATKEHLV